MKISQYIFSFLMGFFLYSLVEIAGRGYTHWTMAVTGGFILALLYALNRSGTLSLIRSCFAGALLITAVEFWVGIFDNLIMHWNVWDYSELPFNIMGQICLPFSLYWFVLCIPARFICRGIDRCFAELPAKKQAVPKKSEQLNY
jgi:uncharacterized membrane protein